MGPRLARKTRTPRGVAADVSSVAQTASRRHTGCGWPMTGGRQPHMGHEVPVGFHPVSAPLAGAARAITKIVISGHYGHAASTVATASGAPPASTPATPPPPP